MTTDLGHEIAHLQELQAKHRKNIRTLEEMLANYGMDRPLPLINNLEFEREQLRQVEERLAALMAQPETKEVSAAPPVGPTAAPRKVQVTVTGPGAAAAGERATAAGASGVAVGGDVHRGIHVQTGGICAGRIEADSVVEGIQVQANDARTATALVNLARAIQRGGVSAAEIKAQNLIGDLRYIADSTQATPGDLGREVAALREQVESAIAAGEIPDAADAEDARVALAKAEAELSVSKPQGNRVVRKLAEATEILTCSAELARAAGKFGVQVIRLAPVAATLWRIAEQMWGGVG